MNSAVGVFTAMPYLMNSVLVLVICLECSYMVSYLMNSVVGFGRSSHVHYHALLHELFSWDMVENSW